MHSTFIEKIDKNGLCLGCGLCVAIYGKESAEMKLQNDGFFHPIIKSVNSESERIIQEICPGVNVINDSKLSLRDRIWGKTRILYSGYSVDNDIREKCSSGGVISALAIFLLDNLYFFNKSCTLPLKALGINSTC